MDHTYTYLISSLFFFPFWFLLFYKRKDLRKEMLIASVCVGICAVSTEVFFVNTYWTPLSDGLALILGDFVYGFLVGGIANVAYEELFGIKHSRRRNRSHHWSVFLLPFFGLNIGALLISFFILEMQMMPVILTVLFLDLLFMISFRRDLVWDAIVSGLIFGAITIVVYLIIMFIFPNVVDLWYQNNGLNSNNLFGIPVGEIYWAMIFGMVASPFYEFFTGIKETVWKK